MALRLAGVFRQSTENLIENIRFRIKFFSIALHRGPDTEDLNEKIHFRITFYNIVMPDMTFHPLFSVLR